MKITRPVLRVDIEEVYDSHDILYVYADKVEAFETNSGVKETYKSIEDFIYQIGITQREFKTMYKNLPKDQENEILSQDQKIKKVLIAEL